MEDMTMCGKEDKRAMEHFNEQGLCGHPDPVGEEGKDGINNLLNIYTAFSGKTPEEAVREFEGVGYGTFKEAVGETVADSLKGIQDKFKMYMDDKDFLDRLRSYGIID